jgi:hypothetical protein
MDTIFPTGLYANRPKENAPNFIIANLSIKRDEFIEWLKGQKEQVYIDIKESKGLKFYASLNEWTPKEDKPTPDATPPPSGNALDLDTTEEHDDLPF